MDTRPTILHYQLTERCNLACPGCYLPVRQGAGRTVAEVEERVFSAVAASGVRFVTLTGGEPLLHPMHLEICAAASRHFVQRLLVCNGTFLTLDKYRELCDAGITSIKVSIDSLKPEVHDRLRGRQGCFDRVADNLDSILNSSAFKDAAVDIGVITTVNEANVSELESIALWAGDRGINHVLFQPYHPYGLVYQHGGIPSPDLSSLASTRLRLGDFTEKIAVQVEKLVAIKKQRIGFIDNSQEMLNTLPAYFVRPDGVTEVCRADRFLFVNSDFGVRGCLFCEELGSLLDQSPEDIYASEKWTTFQRFRQGCKLCLMGCQFKGKAETLADDGFEYLLAGELDKAEECFNESLGVEPSVTAEHGLGLVCMNKGDSDAAVGHMRNVVREDPMRIDVGTWDYLLAHYFGRDDVDESVVCRLCRDAIRRGLRLPFVFHRYGLALYRLGNAEAAAEQLKEAIAVEPGNYMFHQDLGLALKKLKKYDRALESFARAVSLSESSAFSHYALGVELARSGRDDEALDALEKSLALDQGFSWCNFQLGRLHHRHGDFKKAEYYFDQALHLDPGNEEFVKWRNSSIQGHK